MSGNERRLTEGGVNDLSAQIAGSAEFQKRVAGIEGVNSLIDKNKNVLAVVPINDVKDLPGPVTSIISRPAPSELSDSSVYSLAKGTVQSALRVDAGIEIMRLLSLNRRSFKLETLADRINDRFSKISIALYGQQTNELALDVLKPFQDSLLMLLMSPELEKMADERFRDSQSAFGRAMRELRKINPSQAGKLIEKFQEKTEKIKEMVAESGLSLEEFDLDLAMMNVEGMSSEAVVEQLKSYKDAAKNLPGEKKLRKGRHGDFVKLGKQIDHAIDGVTTTTFARAADESALRLSGLSRGIRLAGAAGIIQIINTQIEVAGACSRKLIQAAVHGKASDQMVNDQVGEAVERAITAPVVGIGNSSFKK